jgi:hypothetical protein
MRHRRLTTFAETKAEIRFVENAAMEFARRPECTSYTEDQGPGHPLWIALRWDSANRSITVVRVDDGYVPTVYLDAVPAASETATSV